MSKRTLLALLSIIATMLQVLGSHNSTLQFLAKHIPTSEYKLKQSLPHKGKDQFTKYVVCKRCYSLYKLDELMKKSRCSQIHCSHTAWPDHSHQERRQPCGTPLLHEVTFYTKKTYSTHSKSIATIVLFNHSLIFFLGQVYQNS